MSLEQERNKTELNWKPSATISSLKKRSDVIRKIRRFFEKKEILEVETPCLSRHTVTDPHIQSFSTLYKPLGSQDRETYYLQTSPEYAMKRLLAAGSGPIFQITKSFRNGETSNKHNPEFSMLEWYQIGFDHHQLMDEVDELFSIVLGTSKSEKMTYQAIFMKYLNIDPLTASISSLEKKSGRKWFTSN